MTLNRAMIIGNTTRDPEMRTTATGQAMATFGIATNRVYMDKNGQRQEEVEFHDIIAWGKLGEICGQYIRKGKKIYLDGRLNTRSWDDPAGFKRYKTQIIAENMILLDRLPATDGAYQPYQRQAYPSNQSQPQETPAQNYQTAPQAMPAAPAPVNLPAEVEDLPIIQTEPIIEVASNDQSGISDNSDNNEGEEEVRVEDLPF